MALLLGARAEATARKKSKQRPLHIPKALQATWQMIPSQTTYPIKMKSIYMEKKELKPLVSAGTHTPIRSTLESRRAKHNFSRKE